MKTNELSEKDLASVTGGCNDISLSLLLVFPKSPGGTGPSGPSEPSSSGTSYPSGGGSTTVLPR